MTTLEKLTLVGRVQDRVEDLGLCAVVILGGAACEVKQEDRVIAVILDREADIKTLNLVRAAYDIWRVPIISESDPGMMNQIGSAVA